MSEKTAQPKHTPGQDRYGHFVLFNAGTEVEFRSAMPCSEIANTCAAAPDLLAACKAKVRLSTSAPIKDRWQVLIGGMVDSGHESRQLARKRIDAIRAAAIAKAEGGAE